MSRPMLCSQQLRKISDGRATKNKTRDIITMRSEGKTAKRVTKCERRHTEIKTQCGRIITVKTINKNYLTSIDDRSGFFIYSTNFIFNTILVYVTLIGVVKLHNVKTKNSWNYEDPRKNFSYFLLNSAKVFTLLVLFLFGITWLLVSKGRVEDFWW